MKTKTHGWVLQEEGGGKFVKLDGSVGALKYAYVFATRAVARSLEGDENIVKLPTDVVRKVAINKNGELTEIIPER